MIDAPLWTARLGGAPELALGLALDPPPRALRPVPSGLYRLWLALSRPAFAALVAIFWSVVSKSAFT